MRITDLQNLYREKQGLLQRLRTPRKKNNLKGGGGKAGGVGKMRGPGRPKKKTFPNPRAKMGRPRKQTPSAASVAFAPAKEEEEEEEEEEDEEGEEEDAAVEDDSSSPPVLERQGSCSEAAIKTEVEEEEEGGGRSPLSSSDLIRPPRLSTADSSPPEAAEAGGSSSSTSLSTLTSKFMQGKANPFANLLSQLATTTAGNGGPAEADGRHEDPDEGDEEEEDDGVGMEEEGESGEKFASEDSSSEASTALHAATAARRGDGEGGSSSGGGPTAFKFGKTSKLSYCLEAYRHSKKRKAERPKKNSGREVQNMELAYPHFLLMFVCLVVCLSNKLNWLVFCSVADS
jgi:hypothetical protein